MGDTEPHHGGPDMTPPDTNPEASPLRVILTVADRDTLMDMMAAVNENEIPVRTEDIAQLSLEDTETATLDLQQLTDKQRRTLEIALQTGYYEQPRKSDLGDLADEIGVSKSAVSQRLRAAEAKIIKNAFGEYK